MLLADVFLIVEMDVTGSCHPIITNSLNILKESFKISSGSYDLSFTVDWCVWCLDF